MGEVKGVFMLPRLRASCDIENDPSALLREKQIFWSLGILGRSAVTGSRADDRARASYSRLSQDAQLPEDLLFPQQSQRVVLDVVAGTKPGQHEHTLHFAHVSLKPVTRLNTGLPGWWSY